MSNSILENLEQLADENFINKLIKQKKVKDQVFGNAERYSGLTKQANSSANPIPQDFMITNQEASISVAYKHQINQSNEDSKKTNNHKYFYVPPVLNTSLKPIERVKDRIIDETKNESCDFTGNSIVTGKIQSSKIANNSFELVGNDLYISDVTKLDKVKRFYKNMGKKVLQGNVAQSINKLNIITEFEKLEQLKREAHELKKINKKSRPKNLRSFNKDNMNCFEDNNPNMSGILPSNVNESNKKDCSKKNKFNLIIEVKGLNEKIKSGKNSP